MSMHSESKEVQIASNKSIIKSNSLISAKYTQKYSLHEQKTILYLLSLLTEKTIQKNEYELSIKDYAAFLGVDSSHIYKEAETIAKKLTSKTIQIKEENGEWKICSWISGMRYAEGRLYLSVYDGLKPHLLNLTNNFTKLQLISIMQLSSAYALRVYEILSQYIKLGTRTVKLDVLREMLGIPENELKQFVHFRAKVLDISEREINSKTDIEFDWEPVKASRKIVGIKFNIRRKSNNVTPLNIEIDDFIRTELDKIGFNPSEMTKLCTDYDQEFIKIKIEYLNYKLKAGKIKEPKSWLISAIIEDFDTSDMPKNESRALSAQEKLIQDLKDNISQLKRDINYTKQAIAGPLAKYDDSVKKELEDTLVTQLAELKKLENEFEKIT